MKKDLSKQELAFAREILSEIRSGVVASPKELGRRGFFWSKELKLKEMPSYPDILSCVKRPSPKMRSLLSVKPTRSLSGVQVIAVMLPPAACPGKCTYCPPSFDGKKTPKSYTGFEPSALRAQRLNYDPYEIVSNRIKQLDLTGNSAQKIELIFQGGSFTSLSKSLQDRVVKQSLDAITKRSTKNVSAAKLAAEKSARKVVGMTFETRPDLCSPADIRRMLFLGGTRVELGVQNPDNKIYKNICRGHSVEDVIFSTRRLKDSSFKVLYHLMPGLPGSNYKKDLKNFKQVFSNPAFRPDMVKFYPCLVIKGTKLYSDWKKGDFTPMDEAKAVLLLADLKSDLPKWVRVMRVNRDIPSNIISAGVKKTNLRQLVEKEMHIRKTKCGCIRCREAGLQSRTGDTDYAAAKIGVEFYDASGGEEAFISYESKGSLFGFVRLRRPGAPFLREITPKTALIRELHVYGRGLAVGEKDVRSPQHKGLGKLLMSEAEKLAKERFGADKMVVISGLGVKEYYIKNFGYKKEGPFVSKNI
jgi:elongator complex protein 3